MRPWLTSGRLLPGLTVRRLLTATPAARPLNKTTSAETADNAGTPQLKQFLMVSIKTKFPRGISDQVISLTLADGCNGSVHPGPGLKLQAASIKLQAPGVKLSNQPVQASSDKHQARRHKLQAPSHKQQAPRYVNHGTWILEKY